MASPSACAADVLDVDATYMFCTWRCQNRAAQQEGFDVDQCNQGCALRCQTAADAVMADPVCADGLPPMPQIPASVLCEKP